MFLKGDFAMRKLYLFVALIPAIILGGCATVTVNSDYDTTANFSTLKTYSWTSESQPRADDPRLNSDILDARIRTAVDQTLRTKGFQKISTGTPDFKVAYLMALEQKMDVTQVSTPYYSPYSTVGPYGVSGVNPGWAYGGGETFVTQYEEGTLLLDVVDTKTNTLIWRGTGKKAIDENADSAKRVTNIQKAVQKILAEFPPVFRR